MKFQKRTRCPADLLLSPAGITLTEVVVGAAVLGILALLIAPIILNISRYLNLTSVRSQLDAEGRSAMELMNRSLRQATLSTVNVTNDTGDPFFSKITFTTVDNSTVYSFYQDGRKLLLTKNGGPPQTLSNNVQTLAFAFPDFSVDPHTISVTLTLEKTTLAGQSKTGGFLNERIRINND